MASAAFSFLNQENLHFYIFLHFLGNQTQKDLDLFLDLDGQGGGGCRNGEEGMGWRV